MDYHAFLLKMTYCMYTNHTSEITELYGCHNNSYSYKDHPVIGSHLLC